MIPELREPSLRPAGITSAEDQARLDRALDGLVEDDQWIDDFIKRLNYAIEDIGRKT
jgi:hypothetical protein